MSVPHYHNGSCRSLGTMDVFSRARKFKNKYKFFQQFHHNESFWKNLGSLYWPKRPHSNWTISYKNGHFLLPTTHFHPKTQACFALSPQYKVGSSVVYYVLGAVATLRFFLKEAQPPQLSNQGQKQKQEEREPTTAALAPHIHWVTSKMQEIKFPA